MAFGSPLKTNATHRDVDKASERYCAFVLQFSLEVWYPFEELLDLLVDVFNS